LGHGRSTMPGPPKKSAWSDTEHCCSFTFQSGDKMGRRRGLWAKQEQRNREMLAQCEAGVTLAEIGAEHGVSAERVRQIVRRLGVPGTGPSAWSPTNTATLRRLWRKGLSASLIAEQLGVTRNAITSRANRLDLPSRRPINQEQMFDKEKGARCPQKVHRALRNATL
jgi:DNA-binding CsgD family transcriptional regulator